MGPLVCPVHVDDHLGQREHPLVSGERNIDFGAFMAALRDADSDGFLLAEVGWDDTPELDPPVHRAPASPPRALRLMN